MVGGEEFDSFVFFVLCFVNLFKDVEKCDIREVDCKCLWFDFVKVILDVY